MIAPFSIPSPGPEWRALEIPVPWGEDLDERFNALAAQIDQDEQRKMNKAAAQEWARLPRVRRRRRRRNRH